MKSIYIIGSGGFAKEVYSLIKSLNLYNIIAFIDITPKPQISLYGNDVPVISEIEFLATKFSTKPNLAIGIGDPKTIKIITEKFTQYNFPNIIHPSAIIDFEVVSIGKGNIITAGVIFTTCIKIGDFNLFNLYSTIGHDAHIGNFNVINPKVCISGEVHIGDCNLIGVNSTILQNIKIGNFTTIGANSLIIRATKDNFTYVGSPATVIRY